MDADRQKLIEENERLWAENAELKAKVARLTRETERLRAEVDRLLAALEEARRAGKRQAAPFRKEKQLRHPKKPGRKTGEDYGNHARRAVPTPDQITE